MTKRFYQRPLVFQRPQELRKRQGGTRTSLLRPGLGVHNPFMCYSTKSTLDNLDQELGRPEEEPQENIVSPELVEEEEEGEFKKEPTEEEAAQQRLSQFEKWQDQMG